jgi:FAD/FMN-containing dehydrogenase
MVDALVSAQLVLANGSLIHVSVDQEPERFWAIRGAGLNFGIVIEATFKVFGASFGGNGMESDMIFPASVKKTFWEALKTFDDEAALDPKLSLEAALSYSHETNEV